MAKIRNPIIVGGGKENLDTELNTQDTLLTNLETAVNNLDDSTQYKRPSDWLAIPTLDTTKDEIYILNGVVDNGVNMVGFKITGTGTIDWGDGNTETFTNASQTSYFHTYNYNDIASTSWTEHNKTRQVLVHISGNRGAITYFSLAVPYSYTNSDGVTVSLNINASSDIYEVKADVSSCEVYCGGNTLKAKLESFDWSGNITNTSLGSMFYGCYSLQYVSQLNTINATTAGSMFYQCRSLKVAPSINTSNVLSMSYMFSECYSLQTVPQYDTANVTNMEYMFSQCYSLQIVPQFNTKSVTTMNGMFLGCTVLLSLPQFNTKNVLYMYTMFADCRSLQFVPELDMTNISNMGMMFSGCYLLESFKAYNINPTRTSSIILSVLSDSTILTKQALVDLFNSVATNINGYSRTIMIGATLQGYLANCYVKDSGNYYTTIMPTSDTSIQSGKTYYTYDQNTNIYTQVTPDFSTDTFYYELVTASWNKYVICESSDTGAMLALDYVTNIKGYTIT